MSELSISKAQLIEQLNDIISGKITAQQLQDWMINHFDPPEVEIGPGEEECVQEAMAIIMNEYEIAKVAKFKEQGYAFALAFLACTEDDFNEKKHAFVHDGFTD